MARFYRVRSDVSIALLKHLEAVSDRLIVTYQLEMEFKKNRQAAISEGLKSLVPPQNIPRPGLFSEARKISSLKKKIDSAAEQVQDLKKRMLEAMENPTTKDQVYQTAQRFFKKNDPLILKREDDAKKGIRRRAFRRFVHGCPPRKSGDTSIGDAINWEWMIECAKKHNAELIIVSRDSDYGVTIDKKTFINDHLQDEFKDRVSLRKSIKLHTSLAEALKDLKQAITQEQIEEEAKIANVAAAEKSLEIRPSNVSETSEQFLKSLLTLYQTINNKKGSDG